jgi:phosphatidate cytidylyltransferase
VHLKRWITGLSALPFLIYFIYKGGVWLSSLLTIACLFSLWEYFRIVFGDDEKARLNPVVVWGFIVGPAIIWISYYKGLQGVLALVAVNLIVTAFISLFQFKNDPLVMESIKKQLQGIVYIPVPLSFLVVIRHSPQGMIWVFVLLAVVFAGDITALYVGTFFGRHKLCPAVSPGKTIEGSLGGIAANLVVGGIAKMLFLPGLPWGLTILFIIAVGIAGQVGDLFESELKRTSKVKDSGGLLPGHGGFMDRIDALLFASPVAYCFKVFMF